MSVTTTQVADPCVGKRARRKKPYTVEVGRPHPLGAQLDADGVNFSVFSQSATRVQLLVFEAADQVEPTQVVELDPARHRSFCFWHCRLRGATAGLHYAYRVDGPEDLAGGHRFDFQKVLIDPYAYANSDLLWDRVAACGPGDNLATSMRSVVVDLSDYDWEGDEPLRLPMADTIIYETHVRGLTQHPSSGVTHPGTFAGLVEKVPYLRDLGVTAVELLPVHEFDDREVVQRSPDGTPLPNYWGYSTLGFFSPDGRYCVQPEVGAHVREFRDMVKAMHRAGIEVILDVVYNHTNEGNERGPTISFRGLDNSVYYHLVPGDRRYYMDYSGCGNTVNCNHPVVQKLILESLEFWVREMHVDGFRFDEASILARGEDGSVLEHPPVLWDIELSDVLADTKIIAEAWDAAGLYQIGNFPGYRWAEWNGRYRDAIRRFVAGARGMVGEVATRLSGSADLYQQGGRAPVNSINFITCHDGFTLNDLASYDRKHNHANGEGNRDGMDDNLSSSYGHEGPSDDPALEAFRSRQVKNFCALLMLSDGVPMILGGDEMRRTQQGNNNAYCQDNEISWYDWTLLERHADVHRFFQRMIAYRKARPHLRRRNYYQGRANTRGLPDLSWHGCELDAPGWNDPESRVLAWTLGGHEHQPDLHCIANMEDHALDFAVPTVPGRSWARIIDTAASDGAEPGPMEVEAVEGRVRVEAHSVVVLESH
jgi:isoamylase